VPQRSTVISVKNELREGHRSEGNAVHGAKKVFAFNGVEVGDLTEADEHVLRVRTGDGHEIAISAKAVFDSREEWFG
jgi:hypothetical protein